jgi:hypothetical protein
MSDATFISVAGDRRRWLVLGVIGLSQVMVIMSLTVMNVARKSKAFGLASTMTKGFRNIRG